MPKNVKRRVRKQTDWVSFDTQRWSAFQMTLQRPGWHVHQSAFKAMFFVVLAALFAISFFADWTQPVGTPDNTAIPAISAPLYQSSTEIGASAAQTNDLHDEPSGQDAFDLLGSVSSLFSSGVASSWPTLENLQGGPWGYIVLAVLVAVEGPIATLFGAAAAATGVLSLPFVFVAAILGNLSADMLWYWIGRTGRLDTVARYSRWIRLKPEQVFLLSSRLEQNTTKVLFLAKITAGLVIPTLMAAGLIRAPWRKWFLPIFIGETLWTGALVLLGYYATSLLFQVERTIGYLVVGGSALFFLAIAYAVRRVLRHDNASRQ